MQEIDDNIILKKQREFVYLQVEERSAKDNIQVIKDVKGTENEPVAFSLLSHQDSSETLINNNLTDQHVSRLLKTLNSNDDGDIGINLQEDSINSTSGSSSSNGHAQLSQNSIYLKQVLSKPLILALCEIVAKKPADPVEYLGHWLLHYKICEKRRRAIMQQKERELAELASIDKGKLELKQVDECEDEDEEYAGEEDQNYLDYVVLKI